jgi:ketosteroid isomerase-like protein
LIAKQQVESWLPSWRSGKPRRVSPSVGAEIDRLLKGDTFWHEDGFVYGYPCPGIGRVMQVHHRGRDKLSRQPCGPKGLAGRLADLVASERVPAGPAPSVGGRSEMIRATRGSDYENKLPTPADPDAAQLVLFLTMQSAYALRDGYVEEYVGAYADDVTMVWPTGPEKGKEALRRRARSDIWNGVERRHVTLGQAYLHQTGDDSIMVTGTFSVWDSEKALQLPMTTQWRKRRGVWKITSQQVGAVQLIPASGTAPPTSEN